MTIASATEAAEHERHTDGNKRALRLRKPYRRRDHKAGRRIKINSEKITAALMKHRALIEQRANDRFAAQPRASEITLDIGSLG
jgi:hypothetical protein